jgi:hypothetical protein
MRATKLANDATLRISSMLYELKTRRGPPALVGLTESQAPCLCSLHKPAQLTAAR